LETGFSTTGHSAVLTWLPMSLPTHFSVVVRDENANYSYQEDQTIGIHADGTSIQGGTGLTPNNTVKLVNNWGEWTFGQQVAPQPGGGGGAYFYVRLNGRLVNPSSALSPCAQQIQVDQGGLVWVKTFNGLWYAWMNGVWWSNGSHTIGPPNPTGAPFAIPSPINPPFATSPDTTSITGTSGSLSNEYGTWTIDGSGNANLNGVTLVQFTSSYVTVPVSHLQINAHGQLFLQLSSDSTWRVWTGNQYNAATGPVTGPIPIDITFTRGSVSIPHGSASGTVMAGVVVTMSDGSAFTGTYAISTDGGGHQSGQMSGNNLEYGPFTYSAAQAILFSVTATQNGCSFVLVFEEQLS